MILRGKKKIEYRRMVTHIRERVYIYASKAAVDDEVAWKSVKSKPGDLPTGVLVGTVEVVDCTGKPGDYEWHLARPVRLKRKMKPKQHPQPSWFKPF